VQEAPTAVKAKLLHDDFKSAQIDTLGNSCSPVALGQVTALEHPSVTNPKRRAVGMSVQHFIELDLNGVLEREKKRSA
jgi:hypothetical protein